MTARETTKRRAKWHRRYEEHILYDASTRREIASIAPTPRGWQWSQRIAGDADDPVWNLVHNRSYRILEVIVETILGVEVE